MRLTNVSCLALMSRAHKIANLIGVPLPLIGLVAAVALLWDRMVGPLELGLLVFFYVVTALGVTLGYHRMFTHRAFDSSRVFRGIAAALGSMAVQGSVITWVADHRKHHAFTDHEGDPHSPHLSGPGFWGGVRGLWHAHMGWLFESVGAAERERFAPDLVKDRLMRAMDKLFWVWVALGFAIPFALGWIVGGGVGTALTALLWGGFVRVFLLHHVTWSINSVCHFFGRRRFDIEDESYAENLKSSIWQNKPSLRLWKKLLHIVRYLSSTPHLGLCYVRPEKEFSSTFPLLTAQVDSSFGTEPGSKSRHGWFYFVGGGLVSWDTRHSTRVMSSSTEAECHGLVHVGKENIWERDFIKQLGFWKDIGVTEVSQDNKSAITLSTGGKCHKRSKHFGIEFDCFREYVALNELKIIFCPTEELAADMLTKTLPPSKFIAFRDR